MNDELVLLVSLLLAAQASVKILHWRTRSFAQHLTLDELKDHLAKFTDRIAETALGVNPDCLSDLQSVTTEFSETDVTVFINQLVDVITQLSETLSMRSDALETVLDDFLSCLSIMKYKLTRFQ